MVGEQVGGCQGCHGGFWRFGVVENRLWGFGVVLVDFGPIADIFPGLSCFLPFLDRSRIGSFFRTFGFTFRRDICSLWL